MYKGLIKQDNMWNYNLYIFYYNIILYEYNNNITQRNSYIHYFIIITLMYNIIHIK